MQTLCLVLETCQIWQIDVKDHFCSLLQPVSDVLQPCSDHPTAGVAPWSLWGSTLILKQGS